MTTNDSLAALMHNDYDCIHYDENDRAQWQCYHKAERLAASEALAAPEAPSLRPVERPVLARRCICSHLWSDHTMWCDSLGCPCHSALAAPEVPGLDAERLARALHEAHVGCSYAPGSQTGSESHPPKPVCINRGGHRGNAEAIAAEYAKLREEQG